MINLTEMYQEVEIFTDGSCLGNPGPGGYAAIIHFRQYEKVLSAGYYCTTNNRMELIATIVALESLKRRCSVILRTDSRYVKQGITRWIFNWKKCNWQTSQKGIVKNIDLWKRLDHVVNQHTINWKWIKGHSNHPGNERCDLAARTAALNPTLQDIHHQSNLI